MSDSSNGIGGLLGTAIGLGFGLWGLKILSDFGKRQSYKNDISHILSLSQSTFSGSNERRLLVRKQKYQQAKRILEHYRYKINTATEVDRGIILLIFEQR